MLRYLLIPVFALVVVGSVNGQGSIDVIYPSSGGGGGSNVTHWGNLTDVNELLSSSPLKGWIAWYDGNIWNRVQRPDPIGGNRRLEYKVSTNVVNWSIIPALVTPTLRQVLIQGDETDGKDIVVTSGDQINISTDGYIGDGGSGIIEIEANNRILLDADVRIDAAHAYQVENDQYAFEAVADADAGIFFDQASGNSRIINRDTSAAEALSVYVAGGNSGDVTVGCHLSLGSNGRAGMSCGDINASTIYYDTLTQKSPAVFDFQNGYIAMLDVINIRDGLQIATFRVDDLYNIIAEQGDTTQRMYDKLDDLHEEMVLQAAYEKDRDTCESAGNFTFYVRYDEYKDGSRRCLQHQEMADAYCQQEEGETYKYNFSTQECYEDAQLDCEQRPWRFWRGGECITNPQLHCIEARPQHSWNYTTGSCQLDPAKQCTTRGCGWVWDDGQCRMDKRLHDQCERRKCTKKQLWNGQECVEL